MEKDLLTPELLDRLKRRDSRFADVDLGLKIQGELRDCISLNLIIEEAGEQAANALEKLATTDPSDVKTIVSLQAAVFRARFIARTIDRAIKRGLFAEESLRDEATIELPSSEETA